MAAAKEISHLLRFPGASKIDTFAGGRVRLIKFALTEQQGLDGVAIHEIPARLKSDIDVYKRQVDNSSDDSTKPTVSEFTTVNYIQ